MLGVAAVLAAAVATAASAQTPACPAVAAREPTPAETAYAASHYSQAEDLYGQALAAHPQNSELALQLSAALVSTLVHEDQLPQAAVQANKIFADNPHSPIALTALAEVQLHQGQPWIALETLKAVTDPCYARAHLIRAKILRIDSMYASQRAEIQRAYDIDPADPDIRHAWLSTVAPANEIEGIVQGLASMKNLDADTKQKGEDSIRSMMPMLSENNQTCHVLPTVASATFTLQPSMLDPKHIDGYRLEVEFPKSKARLQVDTAASGLFISRAQADLNGFEPAAGDPPGTVHVDSLRIGPLEFRDCIVGVSDTPFANKADGFIGTDMFTSWLITLDHPAAKLILSPLPAQPTLLPGDRIAAPELKGFMPVYHRRQFLLVPVTLDNKSRKLFILDSGIRFSTMTSEVAHSVSNTKVNFTNAVQTVSGSTLQVYRDNFDLQFANLNLTHQNHIIELDPASIEQNTGLQVAGMLGFDMLHSLTMHLDYRDGLVKLESSEADISSAHGKENLTASSAGAPDCGPEDTRERPIASAIEAKVTGLLDSAHLKPGKEFNFQIVNEWSSPQCSLPSGSLVYGHVTSATASKNSDPSELSLVIDHGECGGGSKKPVSLRIIGLIASPDEFVGLHTVLPSEVSGGGRTTAGAVSNLGLFSYDENLNPGGTPHTIHPGIVAGMPRIKLEPQGGPACSAKITSTGHSVRLGTGSQLILEMLAGN
jgi:tetratricopeptide (TPR) repeat protein